MDASSSHPRRPVEVIDLVSDDNIYTDQPPAAPAPPRAPVQMNSDPDSSRHPTPLVRANTPGSDFLDGAFSASYMHNDRVGVEEGTIINIDGEDVFIPDEELPQLVEQPYTTSANANVLSDREMAFQLHHQQEAAANIEVTPDECLQRVLEIFPDISHEHVFGLWNEFDHDGDYEILPGQARLDNIIEQLVSATSYPKQEKGKQPLKRKRPEHALEDENKWARPDRVPVRPWLKGSMQAMLKAEFPDIPMMYINDTLAAHGHLYHAFVALARTKDESRGTNRPYGKGRPSTKHHLADATIIATNCGWPELLEELNAARKRVQVIRSEQVVEEAKKQAEAENLQKAIAAGETAECSACFDDLPMNRQIHCDGGVAHFTCFDCATTYIKSEVGESRCRVLCPAGCDAGFAHNQLNLLEDKQLLGKLAQLQQEKDIRDAGLDNLEECPFCDYKAILPPIEEDFEFRCANPECEKVSCRRCKATSHVPISCEQHAKDNKINSRHKIEEAMTAAMIRSCARCKKQFIKEYGCNKMTCPSCGNQQCYVCSATLKDYNHFDQNPHRTAGGPKPKGCPLYDNVEERHEREIREAEATARAEVVAQNPDVSAEDLDMKVSDAVKQATADRIRRAGGPEGPIFGVLPPHVPQAHRMAFVHRRFGPRPDGGDEANAAAAFPDNFVGFDEFLGAAVPPQADALAHRQHALAVQENMRRLRVARDAARQQHRLMRQRIDPILGQAQGVDRRAENLGNDLPLYWHGWVPGGVPAGQQIGPNPFDPYVPQPQARAGAPFEAFNLGGFGAFGGDGGGDANRPAQPWQAVQPNNNNSAHHHLHYHHHNLHHNLALNPQPLVQPQPQLQPQPPAQHQPQPVPQAFVGPDLYGQRENFQQLEMLRQHHDWQMRQQQRRQQQAQRALGIQQQLAQLDQAHQQNMQHANGRAR